MTTRPAGRISKILRECKAKSNTFTLKVHITYGASTMKLQGYHIPGTPWVELDYADMIEFPERAFHDACVDVGCDMVARPVKQAGFAYHWLMVCKGTQVLSNTPNTLHVEAYDRRNREDSIKATIAANMALESIGL